jgi:serine phosphatase RsbU (regulator of sigma subunit)
MVTTVVLSIVLAAGAVLMSLLGVGRSVLVWAVPFTYSVCVIMGGLIAFLGLTFRGRGDNEWQKRAGLAYAVLTGALVGMVILWPETLRLGSGATVLDPAEAGAAEWVNQLRFGVVALFFLLPFRFLETAAGVTEELSSRSARARRPVILAFGGFFTALLVGSLAGRYAVLSVGRGVQVAQLVIGGLIAAALCWGAVHIIRQARVSEDRLAPYLGIAAGFFGLIQIGYLFHSVWGYPGLYLRAFVELVPFAVVLVGLVRVWIDSFSPEMQEAPVDARALHEAQKVHEAAIGQERRRASQLQVLNQLAVIINSETDPGRMLDEVLRGAAHLTGARGGSLYLFTNGAMRLEAFSITPERQFRETGARPPGVEARALALQAVAERRLIRLAQEVKGDSGSYHGYMAVPLVAADGEALGCFVLLGAPTRVGFTAEDEMAASTLAAHVSVALQNQRRLKREQQVAEHLQRAMLPRIVKVPGLDLDATYESAADSTLVGGDFYDIIPLGRERTCLVVGDVCGKGIGAATQMTMIRHMLRAYAPLEFRAGRWLEMANDAVEESLSSADFITVSLVVADTATRILDYSLAGHPPPIMALPDEVTELSGHPGLPVGARKGQRYETHRVFLPRGATLVMYTDGVYEARRGKELFGESGLAETAKSVAAGPLRGSAARLAQAARDWSGGRLADDAVVMAFRINQQ